MQDLSFALETCKMTKIVRVIQPRGVGDKVEFLVEWCDAKIRTWEPAATIAGLPAYLEYVYRQNQNERDIMLDTPVICGHVKLDSGEMRFLVNWNRFGHRTWEPRSSFAIDHIEDYLRDLGNLL